MLKCSSRCVSPVRVRPFLIMLVIAIIALSFHAKKASANNAERYDAEYYDAEYVRNDVPVSQIKKGTVLGTLYMKSKRIIFYASSGSPGPVTISFSFQSMVSASPPDPGCTLGVNTSFGILRYGVTGRESVCKPGENLFLTKDITAIYMGYSTNRPPYGRIYQYQATVPRIKLFDVVVNDPERVRASAGKTVVFPIDSLTTLSIGSVTGYIGSGGIYPLSQKNFPSINVFFGPTQPAAFFPQQNSSHALLPLPVKPSGDLATGSASVDLCLYDGAGLTTSRYMLTFQDQNTANTSPYFAVYNNNGTGKMDYSVSLTDPSGTPQPVTNRTPFFWSNMQNGGAAQSRLKYVQLPDGIQGLVPCVPSVVTVKVKPVPYKSLRAGNYTGHLNILFTPSTN